MNRATLVPANLWIISVLQEKPGHFEFGAGHSSEQFCCWVCGSFASASAMGADAELQHEGALQRHVMALIVAHLRDHNLNQVIEMPLPKMQKNGIESKCYEWSNDSQRQMRLFSSALLLNHLLGFFGTMCVVSQLTHVLPALLFDKTQFQYWGWC